MLKRATAAVEVLLVLPAVLFMTALFMRAVQPVEYEPARSADRIVAWYAARQWTLTSLLIGLPLAVLVTGGATLTSRWIGDANLRRGVRETGATVRAHAGTLVIAAATLVAGGILAIVALHVMTD